MIIVHIGTLSLQVEPTGSRRAFLERLMAQLEEQIRHIVARCLEEALAAEVTALLQRGWYKRRKPGRYRKGVACCGRCGSRNVLDFRRNGHYQRYLDTWWGRLRIQVPQLKCVCGGSVEMTFRTLRPNQRLWDDIESEIRERYGLGMSLRWIKACLDARLGSSVGVRTLNQRVREMARLVTDWRGEEVDDVPPVVNLDGIWGTVMEPTGRVKQDRLGRKREVKRGHRKPVLVAQGIWPDSGRKKVVGWVAGRAEDQESWEALLTQLYERGVVPERGLRLFVGDGSLGLKEARQTVFWDVPLQRCVFHKLRNIWRDLVVPEELDRDAARTYKRKIIRDAAHIWRAPNVAEAWRRQQHFCATWEAEQPVAVATMQRDFEDTLVFYQVEAEAALRGEKWPARWLRTTSPLERDMRNIRRHLDAAVLFHSPSGLEATVYQTVAQLTARHDGALPGTWHQQIEQALAALR